MQTLQAESALVSYEQAREARDIAIECLARLNTSVEAARKMRTAWMSRLDQLAEGQQHTLGAYHRPWK